MTFRILLVLLCSVQLLFGQNDRPAYTPAVERLQGMDDRQALLENSLVREIPFRNVGPTVMSGRVVDIAVDPQDAAHFYVAYASGGLWETTNNGVSFNPLFQEEFVMTLGAIAVDWSSGTIWLGTGEVNSSRSSYAGAGMYQSTDGGASWTWMGLPESHHIGRILIHPDNPDQLYVAVLGHLYSPNQERGLYQSSDGGKTWERSLFVNDHAGVVDVIFDPQDPNTLYAASWERSRSAWNFVESGAGSGIHKSTDGGKTWTLLTDNRSGFPTGEGVGRIGLSASVSKGNTLVYAILDNYNRRPKEEADEEGGLTKEQLRTMSVEEFLALEDDAIEGYLRSNSFPRKYTVGTVRKMVEDGTIRPIALVEFVEDANSLLFDTPVIGCEVYRSVNGGKKWERTHTDYLDDIFYSYGYYFAQIRASSINANHLYIMGVPVLRSKDGGKTWTSINGDNVHVDHHALWVNPNRDGHLILGNDGGVNISYDDGDNWVKCNSPAVGQFYAIAYDHSEPYRVFGGLQDNGVWMGPSSYEANTRWHSTGEYPYEGIMGGDGMQIAIDPRDNNTAYTGFQFGNYFRLQLDGSARPKRITPQHELGERPLRWNWQTPIHLSVHNPDILYMGSNKVHRSMNKGDHFETISEDLTTGGRKGDVPYSTLSDIHESSLRFGLLYAGSDDGLLHVSRNGGYSWERISDELPKDMWVSRVIASAHVESRVYVCLNGYRWDHFESYVYASEDYGASWTRIGLDLPAEPVNDIVEDPVNQDLLYVGTDHGVYLSLDRGQTFMALAGGLPAVAVHDLALQPHANELIVGTHGRSIYIGSMQEVQQLTSDLLASDLHIFEVDPVRYSSSWGSTWSKWLEPRTPEVFIPIYAAEEGPATITIYTQQDTEITALSPELKKGLNFVSYQLFVDPDYQRYYWEDMQENSNWEGLPESYEPAQNEEYYLFPGTYKVIVSMGGSTTEGSLQIKE
jgi:photosystem II stability/assembly factor-like uncharacterized protein